MSFKDEPIFEIEDLLFGDRTIPIGTGHHKGKGARAWNYNEFISFDGEGIAIDEPLTIELPRGHNVFKYEDERGGGNDHIAQPQPYILLANSKGDRITSGEDGLHTLECFEFMIQSKQRYPDSIFVGFGLNYDINQWLRDLPPYKLQILHDRNVVSYKKYWIKWHPRKSIIIKHRPTKRSMIIYDTIGFFQKAFKNVCEDYLPGDPRLELISKGKEARELFNIDELDEFIIPYNDAEMDMHVEIMNILRNDLHDIDLVPSRWHGPGAVADRLFTKHKVFPTRETPEEVLDASQFAYAGGRFELLRMGRYPDTVYEYDIHSAYPAAAILLPDFSKGCWEYVTSFEPLSIGLWHCKHGRLTENWFTNNRPQPLFCRSEHGSISYPVEVEGWYWTPEAELIPSSSIIEGYIFRPATSDRPFAFIEDLYHQRRILHAKGSSTERAIKLALNSVYGKRAQTVGGRDGPPRWHQLEDAGYITSYTRAMIYKAVMLNPNAIIATETDAVFSTEPLDLPLSDALGDWELTVFDEICYLQNGFYYYIKDGKVKAKYRGMDKDRNTGLPLGLPYEKVLDQLRHDRHTVRSRTTRYVGLGLGLNTSAVWRSWEKKDHVTHLFKTKKSANKREHDRELCTYCNDGITMYETLHPLAIGGYSGKSYARALPWRSIAGLEALEMDLDFRDMTEDFHKWQ